MKMKKWAIGMLCLAFVLTSPAAVFAHPLTMASSANVDLAPNAKSAVLMDADSGTIIYEKNAQDTLPPASITKIMTMLLVMEAIEKGNIKLNELVRTSEYAASMGGSQIFLESGEEMTVEEMLKGIAMASGNDASVAMAEKIAGSEEMFVQMMNEKAEQLGMKNTRFANSSGLPALDHHSSAYDIALMSKELLKYEKITAFTGKYQDYLRKSSDNPFWLVNTNKLVRFYTGVDGLKTGYTSEAKFCLAATARRDNFRVIAVVLGEPDTKTRNAEVSRLFDYAFAQFSNVPIFKAGDKIGTLAVDKGEFREMEVTAKHQYSILIRKGQAKEKIRHEVIFNQGMEAPIKYGQQIGKLVVYNDDTIVSEFPLEAPVEVKRAGWWRLFKRSISNVFIND